MKSKMFALLFVAGAFATSAFARPHVFFGVGVGVGPAYGYYVPPPVYAPPPPAYVPPPTYVAPAPAPGYAWVGGYWYPYGGRYLWRGGYWARRPFAGAVWVGPRYYGHRYYRGYWRH